MDVAPSEEVMTQQASPNPTAQQTETVTDKNESNTGIVKEAKMQNSSTDIELISEVVPVTVKTKSCEEENDVQTIQEEKSGDDHISGDKEKVKESEEKVKKSEENADKTSNKDAVRDVGGLETTDVRQSMSETIDDENERGGDDVEDMVCESENDDIGKSLEEGSEETMSEPCKDTSTGKQQFSCSQCSKHFKIRKRFETHMKKVHKHKFLHCQICKKGYESQDILDEHLMKSHTIKKTKGRPRFVGPFTCEVCQKVFEKRKTFTNHRRTCGTNKVYYPCQSCSKVFERSDSLKHHTQKYHSESYNSNEALNYHKRAHHGMDKVYTCTDCATEFHVREAYNHHMKSHKNASKMDAVIDLVVEGPKADPEGEVKKEEMPEVIVEDKETMTEVAGTSQEVATIIFVPLTS
uniref:C2H2-type domain-containing protein n=1 Tax=Branchiostoma floridae TaxID=7739 RepID=C3ZKT7_BRAFL|eukprot:XP_002590827.1 hypothetical protein BRAFLDRAFT_90039 [Branchiostoma floridae]